MKNLAELHEWCRENLRFIGNGASRATYENPWDSRLVIKVPRFGSDYCRSCQDEEIRSLQRYAEYPFMPKFHVEQIRFEDGSSWLIIHMERLYPLVYEDKFFRGPEMRPAWTIGCTDGWQLGRNNVGVLKVYDLGHGFFDSTALQFDGTVHEYNRRYG